MCPLMTILRVHDFVGNAAHAVRLIQDCTRQQKEDVCSRYASAYQIDIQEQCEASFSPVHTALFLNTLQDKTKSRAHYVMRCLQEPGNRDLEVTFDYLGGLYVRTFTHVEGL